VNWVPLTTVNPLLVVTSDPPILISEASDCRTMVRVALAVLVTIAEAVVVTVASDEIMGCIFLRLVVRCSCVECCRYSW